LSINEINIKMIKYNCNVSDSKTFTLRVARKHTS